MHSTNIIDIDINDVSLRDGEQAPGNTMNLDEKLDLAGQLHRLGVNGIEAGFAIASEDDRRAIEAVAGKVGQLEVPQPRHDGERFPRISSLARLEEKDIVAAIESVQDAINRGIHVFISTSPIQRVKFERQIREAGGDPESDKDFVDKVVVPSIEKSMALIREKDPAIITQFSPEDWTRTPDPISDDVILAAAANGAGIINLPDTVGIGTPDVICKRVSRVRRLLDKNGYKHVKISWHGHNDTGMGVSNAIAALHGGAVQFEPTILGIGERTGNFSFEGFLAALDANKEHHAEQIAVMRRYPALKWFFEWAATKPSRIEIRDTLIRKETMNTAILVAAILGISIPREHPIVGANAFAHESGIHQDGMMKGNVYEILKPEDYGAKSRLILGKHSGWGAVRQFLITEQMPFDPEDRDRFRRAVKIAGEDHGRRKGMSDGEIKRWALYPTYIEMTGGAFVREVLDETPENGLHAVRLHTSSGQDIQGRSTSAGEGRINAIVEAMKSVIPGVDIPSGGFEVRDIKSAQEGSRTMARATVTLTNKFSVTEEADDTNTDKAIEAALLKAFNALYAMEAYEKICKERQRAREMESRRSEASVDLNDPRLQKYLGMLRETNAEALREYEADPTRKSLLLAFVLRNPDITAGERSSVGQKLRTSRSWQRTLAHLLATGEIGPDDFPLDP